MTAFPTAKVKGVLGRLPLAAELDWSLRGRGQALDGFKLEELKGILPDWVSQAETLSSQSKSVKKVLVFATLHYWIDHACLLSVALAGLGHEVSFGYLPYANWKSPVNKFDLRRRGAYARSVLRQAEKVIHLAPLLLDEKPFSLPTDLQNAISDISVMDTQYTMQVEDVDREGNLFKLRLNRNTQAARAALKWIEDEQPDVVLIPNGLILEFGAFHHAARALKIPVISYEFGEQRDRIWLSRNNPVMLQGTESFWLSKKKEPFMSAQREEIEKLFSSRKGADLYEQFGRRWQKNPSEGAESVRSRLDLDGRPVVLLAANVIGDSLTLGRAIFTGDMSTWLQRTLNFFAKRDNIQLILRVHPGELKLKGPSVSGLARDYLGQIPDHFRIIGAGDEINTYDLIAIADLGLVYTTTVGLEMAMSGVPVIVAGETHYRGKGFTIDPDSWEDYFLKLEDCLKRIGEANLAGQSETAWHYAYRFFFEYPQPFPWHLLHLWEDVRERPLNAILTDSGQAAYGRTFDYLVGEPFAWDAD
jgi:hypothetical protein